MRLVPRVFKNGNDIAATGRDVSGLIGSQDNKILNMNTPPPGFVFWMMASTLIHFYVDGGLGSLLCICACLGVLVVIMLGR